MPLGPIVNATRATRLALVAVSLAALSIAAFAIIANGVLHPENLRAVSMAFLSDVSRAAACTALVGSLISLLLSILAMKARSRCLDPRPRMPLVALFVSMPLVAGAVLLAILMIFLEGLGHMH